ncbi:hypothetical protein O181_100847 [Austropuccinia psidii MF-1]|uniref:Uncharacterized protein n=1 Tax=Austropuccinia psidii MF-1 TaxID=1389203 RepID=A0A9Q3JEV7_9BASI|nr:hypothetical protein [Austropuccinia psidii MF-1]
MLHASLPSWHESQWPLAEIEDKQIFSNFIITHNGFHNEIHVDQHDVNPWTYGLFSFIHANTFEFLQSPHNTFGNGLFFPDYNFILDFAKSNGIIEVLWKTSKIKHQTTQPPLILKNYPLITHFGVLFQISKPLFAQGQNLKNLDPSIIMDNTFSQPKRIMNEKIQEKNTITPYHLTLKTNGCIIFISAINSSNLLITSKHATIESNPYDLDQPQTYSFMAQRWLDCHLNSYIPIHYFPPSLVAHCAKHWVFHQTPYITSNSLNEVKDHCSQVQLDGWPDLYTPIEGIVVRAAPNQTTLDSLKDPHPEIVWKVKFEEPYLTYRKWREITRKIHSEIRNLGQT